MAAAIANIGILKATDTPGHLAHIGQLLRDGLQSQADSAGFTIVQTGPPAMPFLRFEGDTDLALVARFTDGAVRRGILLHPVHNWFMSTAHTEDDVAWALDRTQDVFTEMRSALG